MQAVLPVRAISDLRKGQAKILALLDSSSVLLTHNGQAAGVLIHVDEWNKIVSELDEAKLLKRNIKAAQALARINAGDYVVMTPAEILAMGQ